MAGTAATLQELEVCILCVCVCVCVRASMPCLCMRVSVCFHVCAVCMHICIKISPKHLTLHRIHQLLYHIGASFLECIFTAEFISTKCCIGISRRTSLRRELWLVSLSLSL